MIWWKIVHLLNYKIVMQVPQKPQAKKECLPTCSYIMHYLSGEIEKGHLYLLQQVWDMLQNASSLFVAVIDSCCSRISSVSGFKMMMVILHETEMDVLMTNYHFHMCIKP